MGMTPTIDLSHLAVTRGLVGYWMGGVQGVPALGTVRDLSSEGNDGTLMGSAYVDGDGLNVGSTESGMSFSNVSNRLGTSYTIMALVYSSLATLYPTMYAINGWAGSVVHFTNNGKCYAGTVQSSRILTSAGYIPRSKWIHLAISLNAGVGHSLYKNGVLTHTKTNLNLPDWGVGGGTWGTGANCLHGQISDARIYNRVLSAAEVRAIYDNTKWRHQ